MLLGSMAVSVGGKVVRWEEKIVVVVWCVRCRDVRSAGYRWANVAFEVSRCSLSFTKGLVNLRARQHNRVQWTSCEREP